MPSSARASAISWSEYGCCVSSASIIRLIWSLMPSEAVKKWLNGTTSPFGSMTYFSAVARLTVDSCIPISSPTSARVSGTRCWTPWTR